MVKYLLFPIVKKFRKLIFSMIGVSLLGISLLVGLSGAYMSLESSMNRYVEDYHYADVVLTTDLTEDSAKDTLADIADVYQVDSRLIIDVPVRLSGGRLLSLRAVSYGIRDFQEFFVWEMNESAEYPNIAMEYKFAEHNHIHAGDLIEIKATDTYETVCVGSIVTRPELFWARRGNYAWEENSDFGYLFIPENYAFGTELDGKCNQFVIRTEDWADEEAVLTAARNRLKANHVDINSSFSYEDSPVKGCIDANLNTLHTLSILVPGLFFATMAAVMWLFLSQIIGQCRKEIGILRALGFKKKQIRFLFCLLTLLITMVACLLGIGIGYLLLHFTAKTFGNFFPLPQVYYIFSRRHMIIAIIATLLIGQFAAMLSTMQLSAIMPSEAMSREAPSRTQRTPRFVERLLKNSSTATKYGVASIFRSGKRFAFSIVCAAISMALILVSAAFHVSKNYLIHQLYDLRIHYDAQIFVKEEPSAEMLTNIAAQNGVSDVEVLSLMSTSISAKGNTADAFFSAPAKGTALLTVYDGNEQPLEIPDRDIILERHLAEELGVGIGDSVSVKGNSLKVAAISDQCANQLQYISQDTMDRLGADQYTIVCHANDEEGLLRYLSDMDGYLYTNFTDVMQRANADTFALYSLGVYILIAFSVCLGLLIIYNTTQTNLFEQKRELSVLRSLGFQIREISGIWFIQTAVQFLFACAIGLPLGVVMAKYGLAQMAMEGREYPFVNDLMQFLITVCLVLAYILISHYAAMRNIRKWDIVENIKEKE